MTEDARATLDRAMTEAELQRTVERYLDQFNWLWFHHSDKANKILTKSQKFYALSKGKGFPDLVALRGGVLLFIELKTETGHLAPEQEVWREEINAVSRGLYWNLNAPPPVQYHLWRPRDLSSGLIERTLQ